MEEVSTKMDNPLPKRMPNRGALFAMAILIGLLLGVLATLLVVDIVSKRQPSVVHVFQSDTTAVASSTDTIVKYVIHKYEPDLTGVSYGMGDTLSADSSYLYDESEDLILDDADRNMVDDDAITTYKMLSRTNTKVVYLADDLSEADSHPATVVQIQVWDTPIKNKLEYLFDDNLLKLKGVILENAKICHYKKNYYLVNRHHVYLLHQNNQYERLVETRDVAF